MIVSSRHPRRRFVTVAAFFFGLNMCCRFTSLAASVMASAAGLLQLIMAKSGRNPPSRLVTGAAILRYWNVCSGLHLGNDRPAPAVTADTGVGCTLEHALDMTAFTSRIGVNASQGKRRLVVIKAHTGPGALGRHQRGGKYQTERKRPSGPSCPSPAAHDMHPFK